MRTVQIIKYIADDGKEFLKEQECLDYERALKVKALRDFYGFDEFCKVTSSFKKPVLNTLDAIYRKLDDCFTESEEEREKILSEISNTIGEMIREITSYVPVSEKEPKQHLYDSCLSYPCNGQH